MKVKTIAVVYNRAEVKIVLLRASLSFINYIIKILNLDYHVTKQELH